MTAQTLSTPSLDRLSRLLASHTDSRSALDPLTGLNRYGCAPAPRPHVVALGSCTASSLDPARVDTLVKAYARWTGTGDGEAWLRDATVELRERLRAAWRLPEGTAIAFTPSGTDAESLITWTTLTRTRSRVRVVVLGPEEIGSGSPCAASGRYFDARRPFGVHTVSAGEPIACYPVDRVASTTVAWRDGTGTPLSPDAIEARLAAILDEATARGEHVILHAVACSKTGLSAPRLAALDTWRARHGEALTLAVDAAQARMTPDELGSWLSRGAMVFLTGSKYYGGPPFSGALLVPRALAPDPGSPWPAGMGDFFARLDVPPEWGPVARQLRAESNPGLVFRWLAAMPTMEALLSLPPETVELWHLALGDRLREVFHDDPLVRFQPEGPSDRLAQGRTIWSFTLSPAGRPLEMAALRALHRDLYMEGAPAFHLGQPVALTAGGDAAPGVLRIAPGAPMVLKLVAEGPEGLDVLSEHLALLRDRLHRGARP